LQGFSLAAPQGGAATIFKRCRIFDPSLISEVADKLGTKNVWLNTGTFGNGYALDPARWFILVQTAQANFCRPSRPRSMSCRAKVQSVGNMSPKTRAAVRRNRLVVLGRLANRLNSDATGLYEFVTRLPKES